MADLKVPFLYDLRKDKPENLKNQLLNSGERIEIEKVNWTEFSYKPKTEVYTGYDDSYLWLHFIAYDDFIRAEGKNDQDPVYQDSCVEFFTSVGENYRNFEFNCIGVCLSAIGPDRHKRERLDASNLAKIIRYPSLNPNDPPAEGSRNDWSLTVGIPLKLIELSPGTTFRCNFYKCGDKTKIAHYVTWAPINVMNPDFHRPEYFGTAALAEVDD